MKVKDLQVILAMYNPEAEVTDDLNPNRKLIGIQGWIKDILGDYFPSRNVTTIDRLNFIFETGVEEE